MHEYLASGVMVEAVMQSPPEFLATTSDVVVAGSAMAAVVYAVAKAVRAVAFSRRSRGTEEARRNERDLAGADREGGR